jgi:caa(3)-type oxidase subunit IV
VAIALALAIATVKGSLVAAWFMHLISEKRIIYWMLALAAAFFVPLLLFPTFTMLER